MKSFYRTFLIVSLILFCVQSQAQVKFGVKTGLNLSNNALNLEGDYEQETHLRPAYHVGLAAEVDLTDVISLQSGLLLSSKGHKCDLEEYWGSSASGYDNLIFNYLEIPFHFAYKSNDFQAYAGPYVAIGISGKNKWDVDGDKDETKLKPVFGEAKSGDIGEDEDAFHALDYGLNFGIGYQVGPVLVNAGYSLGLGNLVANFEEEPSDLRKDNKIANRVISISGTIFFGEK